MRKPPARPRHRARPTLVALAATAVLALGAAGATGTAGVAHAEDTAAGQLEFTPETVSPGTEVTVNTTACGPGGSGSGDASSLGVGGFTVETATHKEVLVGKFTVPSHAVKGEYRISVSCTDGVKSAEADLWVTAGGPDSGSPSPYHSGPTGHVRTGAGGVSRPDTPQIAAGAAVLVASAVGGTWLLRRRARETQHR
ncbi:hypothetical protein [Streptomyces sp. NPDC051561]|uniref:hypothetical protein n=1 Tax=Streptomyces sp. NPDC051561 TaxID=3365658 RepID=UPI0037A3F22B